MLTKIENEMIKELANKIFPSKNTQKRIDELKQFLVKTKMSPEKIEFIMKYVEKKIQKMKGKD